MDIYVGTRYNIPGIIYHTYIALWGAENVNGYTCHVLGRRTGIRLVVFVWFCVICFVLYFVLVCFVSVWFSFHDVMKTVDHDTKYTINITSKKLTTIMRGRTILWGGLVYWKLWKNEKGVDPWYEVNYVHWVLWRDGIEKKNKEHLFLTIQGHDIRRIRCLLNVIKTCR